LNRSRKQNEPHFRDLADWSRTTPEQLVETHLAKTTNTARGYREDLQALAKWMADRDGGAEAVSMAQAAGRIIDGGRAAAKRMLIAWINDMRGRHLAAGTIRRRVASVKSLIALASDPDIEIIGWQIGTLPNLPPAGRVRDVAGPSKASVDRMFDVCRRRGDHIGARDEAIIGLLYWHGLRASECLSVRMQDINLDASPATIRIVAKRGQGRMELPLCHAAAEAIERWLEFRGHEDGLLFLACRRPLKKSPKPTPKPGKRVVRYDRRLRCRKIVSTKALSYWGMRGMVRRLGSAVGCRCWPHGLRHAAISHLSLLTGGSQLWGMALSRHKDPRAWAMYQDSEVSHVSAAEVLSRGQVVRHNPESADN
jgi:integrase